MIKASAVSSELVSLSHPIDAGRRGRASHGVFERMRKPASVAVVALLAWVIWRVDPTRASSGRLVETAGGLLLVVLAALGRLWCGVYIAGRKNSELCTAGPYSLSRNPLYLFSSFGVLGIVLTTHRPLLAVGAFGVFWLYHVAVIRGEEARLRAAFGEAFTDYCARTPRVWPRFAGYVDTPQLLVNTKPLLRSFSDVSWFFIGWLLALLGFGGV